MIFHQTYRKIADLVDLEWFLSRGEEGEIPDGNDAQILPETASGFSDEECLRVWLKAQREKTCTSGGSLPGNKVLLGLNILFLLTGLVFFGAGAAISLGILRYDGNLPINLLYAFAVLVFLPFATVLLTLFVLAFYKKNIPPLYSLLLYGFRKLLFFMLKGVDASLPGEKRQRLEIRKRKMEDFSRRYAPLVRSFLFFTFQLGGFFLVAGIFITFLVKVTGSDLAFAWQSTLKIRPEELARFFEILGAPWKPFLPEAVPDLTQIEGSRIFLKDGITSLSGEHLAAWWLFMSMALLVYGLLPRSFLLFFSLVRFRRSLRTSFPDDSRTKTLCFFLRKSALPREKERSFWEKEVVSKKDLFFSEKIEKAAFEGPWELGISDEIPEDAGDLLLRKIQDVMGSAPGRIFPVDLYAFPEFSGLVPLVLALEVFMPPVLEDLQVLQELSGKSRAPLWIWPVGLPEASTPYTPTPEDLVIWRKKLESLPEPRPLLLGKMPHES